MPPSHIDHETRRHLIRGSAAALGALVLGACAPSSPKAAPDSEPEAMADDLTATEGLMREHGAAPDDYLHYVHDIDLSELGPDAALAAAIEKLPGRRFVFTNGCRDHAARIHW